MLLKILGFDPSLVNFGWAVAHLSPLGALSFRATGVWRTKKDHDERATEDTTRRMSELANGIVELCRDERPHLIAVEAPIMGFGGGAEGRGRKSSIFVNMGRTRGLVDGVAAMLGVPIIDITPQALKNALTGSRNAEKQDVIDALPLVYPGIASIFPQGSIVEHAADACGAIHAASLTKVWREVFHAVHGE